MATRAYDEAFDTDGRLRRAFEALRRRAPHDPMVPAAGVVERLRERPLGDDTRILPIPLALEEEEYRRVQAGVRQRALALQALFEDVVINGGRSLAIPSGITPRLLEEMLASHGTTVESLRDVWETHERDEIRFVYAPDLAREPAGAWLVLEDNVGCVGGTADSFFVADSYARAAELAPPVPATADLVCAVQRLLEAASVIGAPEERALAILGCEPGAGDLVSPQLLENERRRLLLKRLGVDVVGGGKVERMLSREETAPRVLVNFDDLGPRLTRAAFGLRHVLLLNAPGTGFLGNKALLPFIDAVVRLHLGEEPLLATPPTRLLHDGELPTPGRDWVVKTAAGAGGTGVFVLRSLTPDQIDAVPEMLRVAGPSGAVAQQWVEPSTLSLSDASRWDAYRVELRPFAYALGWKNVLVGKQPLGKAVSGFDRRRLNNISMGACYLPVLVETC